MKKDFPFIAILILLFLPFALSDWLLNIYKNFNHDHGIITSFVKFAVLATLGELLGNRIKSGNYIHSVRAIFSIAIVWGFLGITIKLAFVIFASGTPILLEYLGIENAVQAFRGDFSSTKLFVAFSISAAMNLVYAPVMMTLHRITDTHIGAQEGSFQALIKPIPFSDILQKMDWNTQWNFIFKKTIILFWIPAHTITFLLPPDYQVLFAALLGIVLGVLLSVAVQSKK